MASRAEEPQHQAPSPDAAQPSLRDTFASRRALRQFSLFAAGAAFFTAAQFITRRAIVRSYRPPKIPFYHPSNSLNYESDGAMVAFNALSLATINVMGAGIMMTGGTMWALDVSTVEDLRRKVRHRVGTGDEKKSDEEIEEWIATVLARKDMKEAVKAATGVELDQVLADAKKKEEESKR